MAAFLVRRVLWLIPVIFVISILTFGAGHLAPGGPFDTVGQRRELPQQMIDNLNRKFHLDLPVWQQYVLYMGDFLQGDLGPSYQFRGESVSKLIFAPSHPGGSFFESRAGRSLQLGLIAFVFATLIGIPLGVISAI